jgi:hypothetical protein
MWIVMTSSAKMPNSCWGQYRNVALVHINQEYTANAKMPKLISERARGVVCLSTMRSAVLHMGHFHCGRTLRSAYHRALTEAQRRANVLNNLAPQAQAAEIVTWGGSA